MKTIRHYSNQGGNMTQAGKPDLKQIVSELEKMMRCNCDLDNWEPERSTGHSFVCRIHKAAKAKAAV